MEAKPGFDLEQKLVAWRQALAASPALSPAAVEELESHLRDSMARLQEKGLTTEEAFWVAARRLGSGAALSEEFGKLNGRQVATWRGFWMVVGILAWLGISCAAGVFGSAAVWAARQLSVDVSGQVLGWVGAFANLTVFAGTAALLWRFALIPGTGGLAWRDRLLRRPWRTGLLLAIALIGLTAARMAMPLLLVRTTPPQQLAWFFAVQQAMGALAALALPLVLVVLLGVLYRRRAHPASATLLVLMIGGLGLLGTGCGKPASPSPSGAGSAASSASVTSMTPLEQALDLWKQGEKEKAVAQLLKVDCRQKNLFSSGNILGYSETQFVALPAAARSKLGQELTDGLAPLKGLCREVLDAGRRAAAGGDQAKAEASSAQVQRLGEALSQPQYTTLVQMVGKAMVKLAASPPAS